MAEPISSKTNRATLKGLLPDWPYAVEVSSDGGRSWSKALRFQTAADRTPPPVPTGLTVTVVGSSFVLKWDNNAALADDFKDYEITVYPTGTPTQAITETRTANSYEFSIYQNRHFFGTPQGNLTFEVRSRDLTYNRSEPVTGSAATTAPVGFTITATAGPRAIKIVWDNQGVTTHYRVYRSASQPVATTTPIGTVVTESAEGTAVSYWDIPGDNNVYWYKVVAVDSFGNTAESNEASAAAEGGLDDTPPSDPAAPTVTGGVHSFTITQPVVATETQTRFVHVYASPTTGFVADESTFVGSVTVPRGATSVEDTFIWVVGGPAVNVFVKTKLATKDGFASNASVEVSAPVSNITEDNVTYIQEISASKLKANTAINKNLTVEALLKMGAGGIIESTPYTEDASGKPTAGWRLTDTTLKMKGAGVFSGTIEADAGWLTNLNVRGNITVGETGYTGAIQSQGYDGVSGWKIDSAGNANLYNATVRGTIQATAGYLQGLDISGRLTIQPGGDIYLTNTNGNITISQTGIVANLGGTEKFRLDAATGNATFGGTISGNQISGGTIDARYVNVTYLSASNITSGSLSADYISGGTITGATLRTAISGFRTEIGVGSTGRIRFYSGTATESWPGYIYSNEGYLSVSGGYYQEMVIGGPQSIYASMPTAITLLSYSGTRHIKFDADQVDIPGYAREHSHPYASSSHTSHGVTRTTSAPNDNETSGISTASVTTSNTGGASTGTAHTHTYNNNHTHFMKNHTHTVSI